MNYKQLVDFVQNRMRMSHVYQPVMLMTLLRGGGRASTGEIAKSILAHDESQVEYYEKVTKNMVGRVLRNHDIVEKDGNDYALFGYEDLDDEQIESLLELCESKLEEYKERRGRGRLQDPRVLGGYGFGGPRERGVKR